MSPCIFHIYFVATHHACDYPVLKCLDATQSTNPTTLYPFCQSHGISGPWKYCRVPAGRGLRRTALAPGRDETRAVNPLSIDRLINHLGLSLPIEKL